MKVNKNVLDLSVAVVGPLAVSVTSAYGAMAAYKKLNAQNALDAPTKEKLKLIWQPCLPAAICLTGVITYGIVSKHIDAKTIAALGSSLVAAKAAYAKYETKLKETLSKEEFAEVRKEVSVESAKMAAKNANFKRKNKGEYRYYYEPISDQFIYTNLETIQNGIKWANEQIKEIGFVDVQDFVTEIGGYLMDWGLEDDEIMGIGTFDNMTRKNDKTFIMLYSGVEEIILDDVVEIKDAPIAVGGPVDALVFDFKPCAGSIDDEINRNHPELDPHIDDILAEAEDSNGTK